MVYTVHAGFWCFFFNLFEFPHPCALRWDFSSSVSLSARRKFEEKERVSCLTFFTILTIRERLREGEREEREKSPVLHVCLCRLAASGADTEKSKSQRARARGHCKREINKSGWAKGELSRSSESLQKFLWLYTGKFLCRIV